MKQKRESDRKYYLPERFQAPEVPESDFSVDISSKILFVLLLIVLLFTISAGLSCGW